MEPNLDHTAITEQSKWAAEPDESGRPGKPFRYDQISRIPDPADPEDCLALADEIDALVESMAREPGNYATYRIVATPEELARAAELLGRDPLCRDLPSRKNKPRNAFGESATYGRAIRDLQERSNKLRLRALGRKPYPVLVCDRCRQPTGWLCGGRTTGMCDNCLRSDIVSLNRLNLPKTGLISGNPEKIFHDTLTRGLHDATFSELGYTRAPALWMRRIRPGRYQERRLLNWGRIVHGPVICGPDIPEDGFTVWLPCRFERVSADNSETLIGFTVARYAWKRDRWTIATASRQRRRGGETDEEPPQYVFPTLFPATLDVETLQAAWDDFTTIIWQAAAHRWDAECDRRGLKRAERDRKQAITGIKHDQVVAGRGTLKVLDRYTPES